MDLLVYHLGLLIIAWLYIDTAIEVRRTLRTSAITLLPGYLFIGYIVLSIVLHAIQHW